MALEELLEGVRQESERVERLEQAIRNAVPEWSLAKLVTAVQAMRGFDLIAAVPVVAEIGDLSRFQNPREPQTKERKCGIQPAHQSLFTDIFASRSLLCTIRRVTQLHASSVGRIYCARCV